MGHKTSDGVGRRYGLSIAERLWLRRRVTDAGCWEWSLFKRNGYGTIGYGSRKAAPVHRVAYEVFVEPIPDGFEVCHRCDNPACFNPTHLFLGTHSENMRDMLLKGRGRRVSGPRLPFEGECRNGHRDQWVLSRNPGGGRLCAACRRESVARYERKRAEQVRTTEDESQCA